MCQRRDGSNDVAGSICQTLPTFSVPTTAVTENCAAHATPTRRRMSRSPLAVTASSADDATRAPKPSVGTTFDTFDATSRRKAALVVARTAWCAPSLWRHKLNLKANFVTSSSCFSFKR